MDPEKKYQQPSSLINKILGKPCIAISILDIWSFAAMLLPQKEKASRFAWLMSWWSQLVPSLKLAAKAPETLEHKKMSVSFWNGFLPGAMLVLGSLFFSRPKKSTTFSTLIRGHFLENEKRGHFLEKMREPPLSGDLSHDSKWMWWIWILTWSNDLGMEKTDP